MPAFAAAVWLLMAAGLAAAAPAQAQGLTVEAPGPYVVDLRGTTIGLPQAASFYPALPAATRVPARGFGFEGGAHAYPLSLGHARVGFGVSFLQVRGTASTVPTPTQSTGSTAAQTFPRVTTTARILAPQVSFNFGTHGGWSYLSAGYSAGQVRVTASGELDATQDSGTIAGFNVGGGARWFLNDHLAAGFDVRLHALAAAKLLSAAAGISLR